MSRPTQLTSRVWNSKRDSLAVTFQCTSGTQVRMKMSLSTTTMLWRVTLIPRLAPGIAKAMIGPLTLTIPNLQSAKMVNLLLPSAQLKDRSRKEPWEKYSSTKICSGWLATIFTRLKLPTGAMSTGSLMRVIYATRKLWFWPTLCPNLLCFHWHLQQVDYHFFSEGEINLSIISS